MKYFFVLLLALPLMAYYFSPSIFPQEAVSFDTNPVKKPNIILITVDTLRADHLGCYNYAKNTTPFLNGLCSRSYIFYNAYTPMPTTDPAHASIHTGLYPSNHGVLKNGWKLKDDKETLAEYLNRSGYSTYGVVSVIHLGHSDGFMQGFEIFDDKLRNHSRSPKTTSEQVIKLLEKINAPFFLWVHFWDPHGPYAPPRRYDLFKEKNYTGDITSFDNQYPGFVPKEYTKDDYERIVSLYDGEIRYVDSELANVFSELVKKGFLNDSLVVITADHGELLDEHIESHGYGFNHGEYLYFGNINVPLIFYFSDRRYDGARIDAMSSNMDVFPTIADYLNGPNRSFDGVSLLPAMQGKQTGREAFKLQRKFMTKKEGRMYPQYSLIKYGYRYIYNEDNGLKELYSLADHAEQNNLSEKYPEMAATMHELLMEEIKKAPEVENQTIDEQQKARLRELGYIS